MTEMANDTIPGQGRLRRAVAALWAFLQAMESTGFDYTLDRIERLEQEVGTTEGGTAPRPRAGGRQCPQVKSDKPIAYTRP